MMKVVEAPVLSELFLALDAVLHLAFSNCQKTRLTNIYNIVIEYIVCSQYYVVRDCSFFIGCGGERG